MDSERKKQLWKIVRQRIVEGFKRRSTEIERQTNLSKLWILDAFQGRLKNGLATNSKKSWWVYLIFQLQTHSWLQRAVISLCILNTFTTLLEPADKCTAVKWMLFVHFFSIFIYCVDIILKICYEGIQGYFDHDWQALYVIVVALSIFDLSFSGCIHYTNILRPAPGVLRARSGRRFFAVLRRMIPGTSRSMLPIMALITAITVLVGLIFTSSESLSSYQISFSSECPNDAKRSHIFSSHAYFGNPAITFYNWFWLVFTNDTYDRLLPGLSRQDVIYLIFFFPTSFIGQKFLLNMVISDTYETFRSYVHRQVRKEKLKEMQGLTRAFSVLDEGKTGIISIRMWSTCLKRLDPELSAEAIALYYELVSGRPDGVTVFQFLTLKNILNFRFSNQKKKKNWVITTNMMSALHIMSSKLSVAMNSIQFSYPKQWYYAVFKGMEKIEVYGIFPALNYVDLMLLCTGLSDEVFLRFGIPEYIIFNITPDKVIIFLYLLEVLGRFVVCEGRPWDIGKGNNAFTWIFVAGVAGTLLINFIAPFGLLPTSFKIAAPQYVVVQLMNTKGKSWAIWERQLSTCAAADINSDLSSDACQSLIANLSMQWWWWPKDAAVVIMWLLLQRLHIPLYKLMMLCRALRCARVMNTNRSLKNFSLTFFDIIPVLLETLLFTLIVSYSYAQLGHFLFGQYMDEWRSPLLSFIQTQQLFYMFGFLESMEKVSSTVHPAAALFFVAYLITMMVVSNIALSVIMDMHADLLSIKSSAITGKYSDRLDMVFNKIKAQARCRFAFLMRGAPSNPLNFSDVTLSKYQSSDVRHFITSAQEEGLQPQDLQALQKHSNLDLQSLYTREIRLAKDLNWEMEFRKSISEIMEVKEVELAEGTVLFRAGEPALKMHLLVMGNVTFETEQINGLPPPTPSYPAQQHSVTGIQQRNSVGGPSELIAESRQPSPISQSFSSNSLRRVFFSAEESSQYEERDKSSPLEAHIMGKKKLKASLGHTNFLGGECLQPFAVYSTTCIAGRNCCVMTFSQDDILGRFSSELTGTLVRMTFKCHEELLRAFEEAHLRTCGSFVMPTLSRYGSSDSNDESLDMMTSNTIGHISPRPEFPMRSATPDSSHTLSSSTAAEGGFSRRMSAAKRFRFDQSKEVKDVSSDDSLSAHNITDDSEGNNATLKSLIHKIASPPAST